ncbi:nitroreductase family protein [Psychroflexus lacisalsi]|jgi:nitroreductase|uniref:Putative NAD(P)H nitroreductase n=1 Tax=Psychroflexus lacisalsi TaxID=503928 RepID=A0ABP3VI48_9FLAO|nr:nitroreductase [Psychroflexus lacisalsi]MBZ9619208.1 nitroreductase [Psychroflexus lacisalsi]
MDILKLIKQRRTISPNQFNSEPISKSELDQILEAANWAPNHKNTEPWRFKVLQGESRLKLADYLVESNAELKDKPSSFKRKKIVSKFEHSHTVIVICMQRSPKGKPPEWEEISAVAMAVQNMWLVSSSLGIGGYWSSPDLKNQVDGFFDFNEGESCLGFFYMGKLDEALHDGKRKSSIEAKVEYHL